MTVKGLMEFLSHQPENLKIVSLSSDEEYHEVSQPRVVRMVSNSAEEFFENKEGDWCIVI